MKILIFLVLAGISLAEDQNNCVAPPKDFKTCLQFAFEHLADFLTKFKNFVCNYDGKFEEKEGEYKDMAKEFIDAMKCGGCTPNQILGTRLPFEELANNSGHLVAAMGHFTAKAGDALKISKPVASLLCNMTGDALAKECVNNIMKRGTKAALGKLDLLACQTNAETSTHEMIVKLTEAECLGDKMLLKDNAMEKALLQSGGDLKGALQNCITKLKDILTDLPIPPNLSCGLLGSVGGLAGGILGK
ncbi:uncharacterized protein RB166_017863 [Leptodactylus fuscus]|uniref:uncharacterized protein LOC142217830 n=1 Tax=Leptodactylus fuscus TaxID=238119 RepID=UPI003F4E6FC7